MANKRKRPQKPKGRTGNPRYMEGMQEIRFSNAAGPHRPANHYRRKPRTGGWHDDV